jgi:lysozyme
MPNAANLTLLPSPSCTALIERSEGFSAKAYWDVDGWSIGYGHHGPDVKEGMTWTLAQADSALDNDLQAVCKEIDSLVNVPLTQGQYDALVDFTFNLGAGRLKSSTLLRLLNSGDYAGAGLQFKHWDIVNGLPNQGLLARREAEQALWGSV